MLKSSEARKKNKINLMDTASHSTVLISMSAPSFTLLRRRVAFCKRAKRFGGLMLQSLTKELTVS